VAIHKGNASVTQVQVGSGRTFALRTDAVDSTVAGDLSGYTLSAGESITLTYRTGTNGASAPSAANTIILRVYYETGTGTLVKELYNSTPPANGTTFTFYATNTGESAGSARAGTLRLYVQAIRTDLGAYDTNSDSDGDQGVIRSQAKVSNLSVSSYPSGSTFAYGTSSNEGITLSATHTQPYAVRGHETIRIDSLDQTTQQLAGSVKVIGSSTTTTQAFTVNDTFDDSLKSYGLEFTPIGTAQLVPDSEPSMLWTTFVDDGASVEQNADTVRQQSFYNVDPRITLDAPVLGHDLYNRGEVTSIDVGVKNARAEALTRSIGYQLKDSTGAIKKTSNDTGPNYDIDYTIGTSDDAAYDVIGKQWSIVLTQSDVDTNPSADVYSVSNKLLMGSAVSLNDLVINSNHELYNRNETVDYNTFISFARGDVYASESNITVQVINSSNNAVENSDTLPTSVTGLISSDYLIGSADEATHDYVGASKYVTVAKSGNTADASNLEWAVSRKWAIKQDAGSAAGTVFTDKSHSPSADNKTLFNRGQDVFFSGLLYNVREELLGNVAGFLAIRRTDQEAYELNTSALTLTADSELTGVNATYVVPLTSVTSPAGRSLVFSSSNTEQPRAGENGTGNFAETDVSTSEWTITDQYQVECRLQKEFAYNTDTEDVVFTIGSDAIYAYGEVFDAVGDAVPSASVSLKQFDPNGIQSASAEQLTQANGITTAASFQPNTPKGEWTYSATTSNEGNSGTNEQLTNHVSAFTANKAIISGFSSVNNVPSTVAGRQTAKPGDLPKPGDRIITGLAFTSDGIRQVITETPTFQLFRFDQTTSKVYILQSDYTWKNKDEVGYEDFFLDFKTSLEGGLEWVASFGTATQGVTTSNGYVTDTGNWQAGAVFQIIRVSFGGQPFYISANHLLAGPSTMHPMDGIANQFFDWE
jgi:hypothetical protein